MPQCELHHEMEKRVVQPYSSPWVRIREKKGEAPLSLPVEEIVFLPEASPSLRLGMIGMKEGETKVLRIPPETVVEIEILSADASGPAHQASERSSFLLHDCSPLDEAP